MRTLHIALNNLRQDALCNALQSLGEYKEIDWIAYKDKHGVEALNHHILQVAQEFQPDFTFMQIQTGGIIDPMMATQIPGFRANWTGDVRQPLPQWYIDLGKVIDQSLFTNTADVDVMRENGCKADYLQIGFDPSVYTWADKEKLFDVVFMGNHYGMNAYPNSKLRYDMAHLLKKTYGSRFQLYGGNWDLPATPVQHNTPLECGAYHRARIAINVSHFDLARYSSDRIHSIMASGAFCLTKWYPEIEKEFIPGEHVGVWHDLDELLSLIDFYSKLHHTRESIAKAGYELVHSRDTWSHRIEQLKTMIPCAS